MENFEKMVNHAINSHLDIDELMQKFNVKDDRELLDKMLSEQIKSVCSGERYHNFMFKKAQECAEFVYQKEGFQKPLVIVCENPFEAMYITQTLEYLYFNDQSFAEKFDNIIKLSRQSNDYEAKELYSKELHKVAYDTYLKLKDTKKFDEVYTAGLCISPESEIFPVSLYSDIYYIWFEFCEAKGLPYWQDYKLYRQYQKEANIFTASLRQDVWVISKYPKKVHRNPQGRLHNPLGSAIEFGTIDSSFVRNFYFINGRKISKPSIFEKGFTLDDFLQEKDEEIRAAMYSIAEAKGNDFLISFLNLEIIDETVITHKTNRPVYNPDTKEFLGYKEAEEVEHLILYHTKFNVPNTIDPVTRVSNGKMAFIKFTCPSTGTNYLIYTSATFKTAIEAAKYARPFDDLKEVQYNWSQRS